MSNNAQPPQPPQPPVIKDEIRELLTEAINQNREANAQIPTVIELKELSKDVGHHDLYIKALGGLLFAVVIGCLIAYMRLDDKIAIFDSKITEEARYVNGRIDTLIGNGYSTNSGSHAVHTDASPPEENVEQAPDNK